MPLTVVFPADRPGDATYASLAAQVEAGMARVVQERRTGNTRKVRWGDRPHRPDETPPQPRAWEHGERGAQHRQAVPLPGGPRLVVTP